MDLNISQVILDTQVNPCRHIQKFHETLSDRFVFVFILLFLTQVIKLLLMERFIRRYKKGEIKHLDQFYIGFTVLAIATYLQTALFLFLFFTATGLFEFIV